MTGAPTHCAEHNLALKPVPPRTTGTDGARTGALFCPECRALARDMLDRLAAHQAVTAAAAAYMDALGAANYREPGRACTALRRILEPLRQAAGAPWPGAIVVIEAEAGCETCLFRNNPPTRVIWRGPEAAALAAHHHQTTGHRTWTRQTLGLRFGAPPPGDQAGDPSGDPS